MQNTTFSLEHAYVQLEGTDRRALAVVHFTSVDDCSSVNLSDAEIDRMITGSPSLLANFMDDYHRDGCAVVPVPEELMRLLRLSPT